MSFYSIVDHNSENSYVFVFGDITVYKNIIQSKWTSPEVTISLDRSQLYSNSGFTVSKLILGVYGITSHLIQLAISESNWN